MSLDRPSPLYPKLPPEYVETPNRLSSIIRIAESTGQNGIYRGSLGPSDPMIYSSQRFIDTVLSLTIGMRGSQFRLMTGPIILTNLTNQGERSILLDALDGHPGVEFRHKAAFYKSTYHCAIAETTESHYELYLENQSAAQRDTAPLMLNPDRYTPNNWQNLAKLQSYYFDLDWKKLIDPEIPTAKIATPWLASFQLFHELQREAEAAGEVFDYMGIEKLRALPSGKDLRLFTRD